MSNATKIDWAYHWAERWINTFEPDSPRSSVKILNLARLLRRASRRNATLMFRKRRRTL
jgi:hypothetical protein